MQLILGDSARYNAHMTLGSELRRAGDEARRMRNFTGVATGVESMHDHHGDGLRPQSWSLVPNDVEELRNRTAIVTGTDSGATRAVTSAMGELDSAYRMLDDADFQRADRHASTLMNYFHSADHAVNQAAYELRPRLGGGAWALLGAGLLGLGGAVAAEHVVTRDR